MKRNILYLLIFLVLSLFSCNNSPSPNKKATNNSPSQSNPSSQGTTNPANGSNNGSNTEASGGKIDGGDVSSHDSDTPSSSADILAGDTLEEIEDRFMRLSSNQSIEIRFDRPYEIWYLFTNTGDDVNLPDFNVNRVYGSSRTRQSSKSTATNDSFIEKKSPLTSQAIDQSNSIDKKGTRLNVPPEQFSKALLRKQKATEVKFETKNSPLTKTPENDTSLEEVGDVRKFYEKSPSPNRLRRELQAVCKHKRKVNTKNGERTLLIYVEQNRNVELPGEGDINKIADCFLRDGYDNDIYDIITDLFGNDWMYLNYDYTHDEELIRKDDTITILFCDVMEQGNKERTLSLQNGYVAGFYTDWNYVLNNEEKGFSRSNERAMITLHGPVSCGDYLGNGLVTLAHEFQHLIHGQYYDINLIENPELGLNTDSIAINECFSSIAESYIANFVIKTTGKQVNGPFMITSTQNGVENGYMLDGETETTLARGRGPWFLAGMDNLGLLDWDSESEAKKDNDKDGESQSASDPNKVNKNYGLVASFADYLLVNYGKKVINKYMLGNKPDLDGIVDAINSCNSKGDMTKNRLLSDWGVATMLSCYTDLPSPYSMNKCGWYKINSFSIPSVNMWQYNNLPNIRFADDESKLSSVLGTSDSYGIISSQTSLLKKNTNVAIRVADINKLEKNRNNIFVACAPTLPEGVSCTLVIILKDYLPSVFAN